MIAKHVSMGAVKKSSFAGLVDYLTSTQGKQERVGQVRITNCQSEAAALAILEVLNTQAQNTRSEADKTYHLIVSLRAGEAPDAATLQAIEERICAGLGFGGHQRISVVHHDTDNLHLHIAINKIHPVRYTVHEPFKAYRTLAKLCDRLEDDYGLEKDNHQANQAGAQSRAAAMEHHGDVESLLGWVRRECAERMQQAASWEQLHAVLRENGLQIAPRANGLVITADNGVSVKASSVGRAFSRARLEQRFGAFAPAPGGDGQPARRYEKKPIASRVDTTELYARYKAEQAAAAASRALAWKQAGARKEVLVAAAKRHGRLQRAAIKLAGAKGTVARLLYGAVSKTLREEIAQIHAQHRTERRAILERHRRSQWADWLHRQAMEGGGEALAALRARKGAAALQGDTVGGQAGAARAPRLAGLDGITRKGTLIYRAGASAVRDDGDRLKVSRGADRAALEAALRMAIERYGERIRVNGSDAFKEQIARAAAGAGLAVTFDEAALERRRRQLAHASTLKQSLTKEETHGPEHGRRDHRGGDGKAGRAGAGARAAADTGRSAAGHAARPQPHARGARQAAPPASRDGMRNLSALGLVRVPDRTQVLLPDHVPDRVELQGSDPAHGVRRDLHRPGGIAAPGTAGVRKPPAGAVGKAPPPASIGRLQPLAQLGRLSQLGQVAMGEGAPARVAAGTHAAANAADRYIAEREQKRARFFDIPKHVRYTPDHAGAASYAGVRQLDGQSLALLKQGDDVVVLQVDDATARRLRRLALGAQVGVTAQGVIKKKGRSR